MIISQTPFRVSFFGGGSDYPDFFDEHGGAVLGTTINKYSYISLHQQSRLYPHRFTAHYARTEQVGEPSEFEHPLIRETLRHLDINDGLEISHIADLPGRTGIGSSSTFTVGLLNALRPAAPEILARDAIHIERERVGDAGGHQDQILAAHGGFLRVDFTPSAEIRRCG
ncbi:MAG: hypothetical protein AAF492_06450 [Verrucomicrobiota bacterium]